SEKHQLIQTLNITDLVVHQVARLLKQFPLLNASLTESGIQNHETIDIGVTTDVQERLYLVTLPDADTIPLHAMSLKRLGNVMELMRGNHHAVDLSGGTFAVTVLNEPATSHQIPIIYPGHAAILGLGGVQTRFRPGDDGLPTLRQIVGLCISYDHRFINGALASRFMQAVADALASPVLDQE
ncbi:MAG: 2-oxo acid dehydrogenase subunit E2, partial [Magnetococcales bacterium]|nr:2-oxo acid dehydrogenase subunit E2 [Magnetococcales bacterium]